MRIFYKFVKNNRSFLPSNYVKKSSYFIYSVINYF